MTQSDTISRIDLSRLYALSLDMLCVATLDGYFQYVNPSFARVLGYSEAVLLSTPFLDFVHPNDREDTISEITRLASGFETVAFENRYRCVDGQYKTLAWAAAPDPDSRYVYASARDVTQQIADANDWQRNHRAESLTTLTAGIAHDLNNLLTPILLSVEMLEQKIVDDGTSELYSNLIDTIDQGRQLVNHLRDLTGSQPIAFQQIDVEKIIHAATGTTTASTSDLAELEVTIQPGLWPVMGNGTQLFRVILNLLKNAEYATEHGGVFSITAKNVLPELVREAGNTARTNRDSKFVLVEVADNGKGISPKHAQQVFSPFFSTHPEDGGTGIGLAVVSKIVADHGGTVSFESQVGLGTKFTVLLPASSND